MQESDAQEQIHELQTKLAFQDDAIQEITKAMVEQQKQITELREMVSHLHKQIQAINTSQVVNADEETPPPHY